MTTPSLSTYGGLLRDFGYAGDQATMNPISTLTLSNEGTTAIGFAGAVMRGATDITCLAVDGSQTRAILGLALRQPRNPADVNNQTSYVQYDMVPILQDGDMWAVANENVVRDDPVLAITTTPNALGGVSAGAASGTRIAVPGAKWQTTTAAGAVGRIRVNVPG